MLKQKRIHVTTADIAKARIRHEDKSPIALALRRAYPKVDFLVRSKCILLLANGIATEQYLLPPRITDWIDTYDYLHHPQPIEFTFPSFEE